FNGVVVTYAYPAHCCLSGAHVDNGCKLATVAARNHGDWWRRPATSGSPADAFGHQNIRCRTTNVYGLLRRVWARALLHERGQVAV
ncbi:unnamed protein product, partial [Ectocarpus fasciculatus]